MSLFANLQMVAYDGKHYIVHMAQTAESGETMAKIVPGSRRHNGAWKVPVTSWHETWLKKLKDLHWTPEALAAAQAQREREEWRLMMSKLDKLDYEWSLPGFGVTPRKYQDVAILYGLDCKRLIVGDQMGLGKSVSQLGIIYGAQAFPALLVVPKSLKQNWLKEIKRAMPGVDVIIAKKNTPLLRLQMAKIVIVHYEQMLGRRKYYSEEKGKETYTCWKDLRYKNEVILSPLAENLKRVGFRLIGLDEGHKIKEDSAGQTHAIVDIAYGKLSDEEQEAVAQIADGIEYRVILTGTPMVNKPKDLYMLLKFLGLQYHFGGHTWFCDYFGGTEETPHGVKHDGAFNTLELNDMLRRICYVRREKKHVWQQMPAKNRTCYPVEITNKGEYDKAYNDLLLWVEENVDKDRKFMESIKHLGDLERALAIRERKAQRIESARRGEILVRMNALKKVATQGKLKAGKEWIDDFLESGEKLIVMAINEEVHEWFIKNYPKTARIISKDSDDLRQHNVERFQNDPNCQTILCAMGMSVVNSPGGVGHTLTASSNVLFLQLGWTSAHHDQCEDRAHRDGQEAECVDCHYLLAENTIEIDIAEKIEEKRAISAQVVDGKEQVEESRILDAMWDTLVERVEQKKGKKAA